MNDWQLPRGRRRVIQARCDPLTERLTTIKTESARYDACNDDEKRDDINQIIIMLNAARKEVEEQNELIDTLVDELTTTISTLYTNHQVNLSTTNKSSEGDRLEQYIIHLVCLGVGSVVHSKAARYQFALACLIHDQLKESIKTKLLTNGQSLRFNTLYYDPLCSTYDRAVIESCNFIFDNVNQEGRHVFLQDDSNVLIGSIVFAPHCTSRLSMNILESNWGHSLDHLILIANSFAAVIEARTDDVYNLGVKQLNKGGKQRLRNSTRRQLIDSQPQKCFVHSQAPSQSISPSSCVLGSICCVVTNGIVNEFTLDPTLKSNKGELYAAFHSLSIHRFYAATPLSLPSPGDDKVWNEWKSFVWDANVVLSRAESAELITRTLIP